MASPEPVSNSSASFVLLALAAVCSCYIVYQRFLHPLARFPGPLIASLTNTWKSYHTYNLRLHEEIVAAHQRYGSVVRIGPNDLLFWDPSAISIYKAGRSMVKTDMYDAFTTFNPNLFGTRDEDIHALRRRQLAHGFSQTSINELEPILDGQLQILCRKLREFAKSGEVFDLKEAIACYVLDIVGAIAFSRSFETQTSGDTAGTHAAINEHILLGCVIGQMPFQSLSKLLIAWSPIGWMRRLVKSRAQLKATCADCVRRRIETPSDRKDLLQSLIDAKDPESGAKLTELDINTEAFAFLIAGSHTTSGTLSLLFWHLMHNPKYLDQVTKELDENLGPVKDGQTPHQINDLNSSLDYTRSCIQENFRINPVFTMTLWRRVTNPEGAEISGVWVPQNTNVAILNYALHHNPDVWGPDHDVFDPNRWSDERAQGKESFVLPFSVGHRFCIGKNLAMTNILKTTSTLLTTFAFDRAGPEAPLDFRSSGIGEIYGPLLCTVKVRDGA